MTFRRLCFFSITLSIFSVGLLGLTPSVRAAICTCTFGAHNDCSTYALDNTPTSQECADGCRSTHGVEFQSFTFDDSNAVSENSIELVCSSAHSQALNQTGSSSETAPNFAKPNLEIEIPGVSFSDPVFKDGLLSINFFGEYLQGVYKWLLGVSVIFAIVIIMIGGLQYSLGAVSGDAMSKAKERIKNGVIGLVLLLLVYVILNTVNPQLLNLGSIELPVIETVTMEFDNDAGDIADSGTGVCNSQKGCVDWCNSHRDEKTWPTSNDKTIDPTLTQAIVDSKGIVNSGTHRATEEMTTALARAGELITAENANYFLEVRSAFRPLKTQIKLVCERAWSGNEERIKGIGSAVAFPGRSNHGSGSAVDVRMWDGKTMLITTDFDSQKKSEYKESATLLAKVMEQAGFVRYGKEIWHFELKRQAASACRCSGAACPFPPSC